VAVKQVFSSTKAYLNERGLHSIARTFYWQSWDALLVPDVRPAAHLLPPKRWQHNRGALRHFV